MIDPFPIGFWCDIPWDAEPPAIWWTPIESCRWPALLKKGRYSVRCTRPVPLLKGTLKTSERARAPPVDAQ